MIEPYIHPRLSGGDSVQAARARSSWLFEQSPACGMTCYIMWISNFLIGVNAGQGETFSVDVQEDRGL